MTKNLATLVCSCSGYPGAMPQCDHCRHQAQWFDGEESHLVCKWEG